MAERGFDLVRRGALDPGAARMRNPSATIEPVPPTCRIALRVEEAALARMFYVAGFPLSQPINRLIVSGSLASARLGPDEWVLYADAAGETDFAERVSMVLARFRHSAVDVSHRYAGLTVSGPRATEIVNAGCPLDLGAASFPTGTATRTLLGKAEIVLMRLDDAPAYRIECARSFARYVEAFLAEAAREFA